MWNTGWIPTFAAAGDMPHCPHDTVLEMVRKTSFAAWCENEGRKHSDDMTEASSKPCHLLQESFQLACDLHISSWVAGQLRDCASVLTAVVVCASLSVVPTVENSLICGCGYPYKASKGVSWRDEWKELLYQYSPMGKCWTRFFGSVETMKQR